MAAADMEAAVEAAEAEAAHRKFLASVGVETNGRRGVVDLSIAGRYALETLGRQSKLSEPHRGLPGT